MKSTLSLLAHFATQAWAATEVLDSNVTTWTAAKIKATVIGGFADSKGLRVRGEIGWHTHGSGENKDVDIDLAIILETDMKIATNYSTFILWALPMQDHALSDKDLHEVGML